MPRSVAFVLALVALAGTRPQSALFAQATSRDSIARVRLVVREQIPGQNRPPILVLAMETLRQYPCLGFGVENSFRQRGETLQVGLVRVVAPDGLCPQMIGPATLTRELHVAPGRYALLINYRSKTDVFTLDVTDSSAAVVTEKASYVEPDTRLRWRFPRRSFALFCENVLVARPVCEDVQRWLRRQVGITQLHLSSGGLNPYRPDSSGAPDQKVDVFRYAQDEVLDVVRRCFAEIEKRIRDAVGVFLTLRTWTGEEITAWSRKAYHDPHIPVPERVTAGPACAGAG